jgi:NTE family protein
MTTRALVLGGGGVAGIAWEIGLLAGLARSGVELLSADLIIGTSAGAAVAAQVTSGVSLDQLLARQTEPAQQVTELAPAVDVPALLARIGEIGQSGLSEPDRRRAYGRLALTAPTVAESARRAVLAERVPVHEWPDRDLRITVVDTADGEPAVFDRHSGVALLDAVAASCAVPGVWPPVTVDGRRYMDGGMRSPENADLAAGYDKVLVLQVFELPADATWGPGLPGQVEELRTGGSAVEVVNANADAAAAFGQNPLDPATRVPSAHAGLAQGRADADRVRAFWD